MSTAPQPGSLAEEASLFAAAVRAWMSGPNAGRNGAARGVTTEDSMGAGAGGAAGDGVGGDSADGGCAYNIGTDGDGVDGDGVDGDGTSDQMAGSPCCGGIGHPGGDARQRRPPWDGSEAPWTCGVCPLCRLIGTAVAGRPEAAVHLLEAIEALTAAVRSLHAAWTAAARPEGTAQPPAPPSGSSGDVDGTRRERRPRVQRIDVT